jgi:DNA-binding transcriptional MerR regulator
VEVKVQEDASVIQGGGAPLIPAMNHSNQSENYFTVNQVSEKLKIPKPTLRFWEKELASIIAPLRTNGRQRRYTQDNLAALEKIRDLRNAGKSLAEIRDAFGNNFNRDNRGQIDIERLSRRIAEVVKDELTTFFNGRKVEG